MGNTFGNRENVEQLDQEVIEHVPVVEDGVESVRAQKRSRDTEDEAEIELLLHTPKKKRLKTTSR